MITTQDTVLIGTLTRTHGKQGEVQCRMNNELWDNADAEFLILNLQNILVPFRVMDWRGKGAECLIFQLAGIDNEEKALPLIGADAYMLRKDVTTTDGQEEQLLTWQDLEGYQVLSQEGTDMGKIVAVDESTANILATTDQEHLVPLHEDLIMQLDTDTQLIQIQIPYKL